MGKYQLDYKGQASVQKFHEKNSNKKTDKLSKIEELKKQHQAKKKKEKEEARKEKIDIYKKAAVQTRRKRTVKNTKRPVDKDSK